MENKRTSIFLFWSTEQSAIRLHHFQPIRLHSRSEEIGLEMLTVRLHFSAKTEICFLWVPSTGNFMIINHILHISSSMLLYCKKMLIFILKYSERSIKNACPFILKVAIYIYVIYGTSVTTWIVLQLTVYSIFHDKSVFQRFIIQI